MENRDTTAGRYVAHRDDYPSQSEFGPRGEYVDVVGRQYRLAYCSRIDGWPPGERVPAISIAQQRAYLQRRAARGNAQQTVLWVKLPTRRGKNAPDLWFTHEEIVRKTTLHLMPIAPGLPRQTCTLQQVSHHPRGRSGSVTVAGFTL